MNKFREYHLFKILYAFDQSTLPLDVFLRNYFIANKAIGAKDRRFIADMIYGMIRWRGLLDYLIEKPCSWENRYHCYRSINPLDYRTKEEIPLHVRASFPKAFFQLFVEKFGEVAAFNFCQISNHPAPTTVRTNLLKTNRESLLNAWENLYQMSATKHSSTGILFHRKINFFGTPEFKAGYFEVQDEGSQLVAELVKAQPKDSVLDYCAGSGGKSLAIAPHMQNKGIIYLHDIRPRALEEARKRLRRAGIHNAQILYPDSKDKKKLEGKMDWVLADVPCTGTGTLRRNPDMKWRFDIAQLKSLLEEQKTIFEEALRYVRPGGHIVYATCSVLPQENQEQIQEFLTKHPLTPISSPFSSSPSEGGMDGFFACVLKKLE